MVRFGLLLAILTALLFPVCSFAQTKQFVVIVAPGLKSEDLTDTNFAIDPIISQSAIGWMNSRTARVPGQKRDPEAAAYLTLGAGSRAVAGKSADLISPESLAELKKANGLLDHPVSVGALGDMLRQAGILVGVEGAEDDTVARRAGKLIAIDSQGKVYVDSTEPSYWSLSEAGAGYPYGIRQWPVHDWRIAPVSAAPPFSVFIWGDLARADRYAVNCLPVVAAAHRANALKGLRQFIANLDSPPNAPVRYLLLAPGSADTAADGDRLAPILMWGEGVKPGFLTSGSTHTLGLVTNTDFLPTVAAYFNLSAPKGSIGRPMTSVPFPSEGRLTWYLRRLPFVRMSGQPNHPTAEMWAYMHDRWYSDSRKQSVFGGLPTVQFLLVLAGIAASFGLRLFARISPSLLSVLVAIPPALLILPLASPAWVLGSGIILGAFLAAIFGVVYTRPDTTQSMAMWMCGALTVFSVLDLLTGASLMRQAWMSYSVMEGARYYGIGNEYAGAVFAAMMLLSAGWLRGEGFKYWKALLAAWIFCIVVIGMPQLGADAGDFVAAAIGCGAAAMVWWRGRIRFRDVGMVIAGAALLMGVVLIYDLSRGGADQSHIARAVAGGGVVNIAVRKLLLNGYLLLHSVWSLGLAASLFGFLLLWRNSDSPFRKALADRGTSGAFTGLAVGAIALFLFNDSGTVAASQCLMLAYAGATILFPKPGENNLETAHE